MRKKHPQKDALLYRLVQPGAPSIATLSEETGISKPTLYAWLRGFAWVLPENLK